MYNVKDISNHVLSHHVARGSRSCCQRVSLLPTFGTCHFSSTSLIHNSDLKTFAFLYWCSIIIGPGQCLVARFNVSMSWLVNNSDSELEPNHRSFPYLFLAYSVVYWYNLLRYVTTVCRITKAVASSRTYPFGCRQFSVSSVCATHVALGDIVIA